MVVRAMSLVGTLPSLCKICELILGLWLSAEEDTTASLWKSLGHSEFAVKN